MHEPISTTGNNTFHLGLAMAGAVSAGAYTAGVLDYLFETLERWEQARGNNDVPTHKVVLDVMGGASAGGMCAAIAPLQRMNGKEIGLLKDLWINIAGKDADMFAELLKKGDIEKDGYTVSMLNSRCIDGIGERTQKLLDENLNDKHIPSLPVWISPKLEILLTMFNISGLKYALRIKNLRTKNIQNVFEHRDLAHFRWSKQYANDGRIPLWKSKENLETLVQAAKATGAFPFGLSARKVKRNIKHIIENRFITNGATNSPIFDGGNDTYESLNVDGGTANNEPLEFTRKVIEEVLTQEGRTGRTNSGLILIDPFPAFDKPIKNQKNKDKYLKDLAGDIFSSMRSQLLFDAKEIDLDYTVANRHTFMIAPAKPDVEPDEVLACGGLGGFSGFIYRGYREHDYQLGRRNCQQFLRFYFVVDADNPEHPIVKNGYSDDAIKARYIIEGKAEASKKYLPIIPDTLFNNHIRQSEDIPSLELPDRAYLYSYAGKVRSRVRYVFNNMFGMSLFKKALLYIVVYFGAFWISSEILDKIYEDLHKRKLIKP